MQIKKAVIKDLKFASYNPKNRTKTGAKRLSQLQASIEEIGLLYPILITADNVVVEGHRRLQACTNLGWEVIPALTLSQGVKPDKAYAEANACAAKHTGNDNLYVWLNNPGACTSRTSHAFERLEAKVGKTILRKLCKLGVSIIQVKTAEQICRYCDVDENDSTQVVRTVEWLIEHRTNRIVRSYMTMMHSPKELWKAILKNKGLRVPDSKFFAGT